MKRRGLLGVFTALVLIGGVGVYSSQVSANQHKGFYSTDFTPQQPITQEMQERSFDSIHTDYGVYNKVGNSETLPGSQTAHSMAEVNEQTKQIDLGDYGVFMKQ